MSAVIPRRVFVRSPYNYDRNEVSIETGLVCPPEEGKTQQSAKSETDINEIVRRFGLTGKVPVTARAPLEGDFTGVTDFQSAMQAVRDAERGFAEFPASIRSRFRNDPQAMLVFLNDPKNEDEARKLGLVKSPPERTRDVVQAVDELAAKLTAGGVATGGK